MQILTRNNVNFNLIEINNGFAKLIRVDDEGHRQKIKTELVENPIFQSFYKVIQRKIIKRLDEEPGYFYVPEHKLKTHFKRI